MKRVFTILAVFTLAYGGRAWAQVNAGEASVSLNGTVSAGYSDDYSNVASSDHNIFGAGQADLSGSYYNPNFLSFDVQPFYNQSRLNSTYQSMTAASGVTASAKIFGGSPFPGSISYSTVFNSTGTYNVPGLANFTTHGNNDVLALTWGVHVKGLPSLNLSFSDTDNDYSVYGAETRGALHSDVFSVTSAYSIAGFKLNGGYQYMGIHSLTPEFLSGELPEHGQSGTNSFFLGVGHDLPLNGSLSAGASHLKIDTNYGDTTFNDKYDTSIDTLTGALNFAPVTHLNVGANAYYTDNLLGSLYNTLVTAGSTAPLSEASQSSHDLSLTGNANYNMPEQHLYLRAYAERQEQTYLGNSYAADSYNGTATYFNTLLGGQVNSSLGVTRTSVSSTHQGLIGLNAVLNYTHPLRRWNLSGGFSYSQDTQTVLINYTTSGYTYNGSVGRRLRRRSYWAVYASGMRSLLTNVPGSANSSQSYSTSLSLPRFSVSAAYSTSGGNALLTSTGLVATPVPLPVVPSTSVVLYNGKAYSAALGASPIRGLTLTATYARALSGTTSSSLASSNNYDSVYFLMIYQVRKLSFQAGYNRMVQGFSITGAPPTLTGAYYLGVSRWFNFF